MTSFLPKSISIQKIADAVEGNPELGAIAGGSLPAASLIQYYLGDYRNTKKIIETAPVIKGDAAAKMVRPGDVAVSSHLKYDGPFDGAKFLHEGSKITTGSPAGHAMGIGTGRRVFHGGAHHSSVTPGVVGDRISNILASILESKGKTLGDRYSSFGRLIHKKNTLSDKILANSDKAVKGLKSTAGKFTEEVADDTAHFLFRNPNLNKTQINAASKAMAAQAVKPYSFLGAVQEATKRVFLPKMPGKATLSCNSAMCGDMLGAHASVTGGGMKGRNLPVDIFSNKTLTPIGITTGAKMSADKLRGTLMKQLTRSAIGRTGLGVAAIGAGSALGSGIQSVGEGIKGLFSGHNSTE